ncbi:hypothetical protein AQJ30_25830 [Streptomyces longwoodensis]|uniref:YdhG-like domain-containing protein n=1 Tax=Streptomyces longwoodensis TaxID=68231 RepID=A0A101QT39_9ACTN|nr:DUF1801 domain-containing protein [Streptomyces longwoodensis]KUN35540.1 hypothetical protein AQJ30_25830 [Streptomyces longwoodensis]
MGETGFTAEERAAMKERARETRGTRRAGGKADPEKPEKEVLAKIAEMEDGDRALAERVHALVTGAAPQLAPKLWFGMPAYARDGKVVCFFQCSAKFKARYSTLGFNDPARLDDGAMWPTAFAVTPDLTADDEALISALVRRAAG